MSAIAGVFSRHGEARNPNEVSSMLAVMARRGPDATGEWARGEVSLGHGALHSTPSAVFESQPLVDPRSGNVIVADVRLDNRQQLIGDLRLDRTHTHPIGDAAILLAAYERWGIDFPVHLLGDFAFAIWDGHEQQLVLGRDHFGAKPLMYFASDGLFAFASDARAIVGLEGVPRAPNRSRMIDLLVDEIEAVDTRNTFFEEVFRLPPATTLAIQRDQIRERTYWQLEEPPILRLESSAAYEEALRETLGEAVRSRMQGQHAVGTLLSGGVDSAAVVALVARHQAPRTFSATTNEPGCVETRLIKRTVAHLGADATYVLPEEAQGIVEPLGPHLGGLDNPFGAGAFPAALYATSRQEGVRAVLSGVLADEVIDLSPRDFMSVALDQRRPAAFLGAATSNGNQRALYGSTRMGRFLLGSIAQHTGLRQPPTSRNRAIARLAYHQERLHLRLDDDDRRGLLERFEIYYGHPPAFERGIGEGSRRTQLLARGYATAALERFDRFGAHCGLDVRTPYLDRRVVAMALSLPFDQIGQRGYSKAALRSSVRELLPHAVVWSKTKHHLGWQHTKSWITDDDIERLMTSPSRELIEAVVDVDALRRSAIASGERMSDGMYSAVLLVHWLEGALIPEN